MTWEFTCWHQDIVFFQIVAAAVVRVLTYTEETMCWIKMTKYLETTLWMRHKPYKEYSNAVIFIFVEPITVTKILVDCLFYLKYKSQGNFHELPHWIFPLLSKQCASELNLLAQNSCSSGVHNNVNFEQYGEAKISHECDPCVFKVKRNTLLFAGHAVCRWYLVHIRWWLVSGPPQKCAIFVADI